MRRTLKSIEIRLKESSKWNSFIYINSLYEKKSKKEIFQNPSDY